MSSLRELRLLAVEREQVAPASPRTASPTPIPAPGGISHAVWHYRRFCLNSPVSGSPSHIDAFNSALIEHLRRHRDLRFDYNSLSCHNGQTSGEILIEPKGPVHLLESIIERAGHAYRERLSGASHPWVDGAPGELQLSAWCTVLRSQGYQHGHIHPSAWLWASTTCACRRRAPRSRRATPMTSRAGSNSVANPGHYPDGDQGEIRTIPPAPGTLVLFPSFVYHRTIPFDSDDERITIAFDFRAPGEHAN